MTKACPTCGGRPTVCGHPQPTPRGGSTRAYRKQRALALAGATNCWICRQPFTQADPPTADHVRAYGLGGADHAANLRPAHLRCNQQRGMARAT